MLVSYIGAARILETDRKTVAGLVKALGITPKSISTNGKAKGLDQTDLRRLRKALGRTNRRAKMSA
jgi:hypothetical protein